MSLRERSDRLGERVWVARRGAASPHSPADPHPALRATFSQWEKESELLTIRRLSAYPPPPTSCFRSSCKNCSVTNHPRQDPCQTPAHPVGGEGVGSTFSMAAGCGRAMKPGGRVLRGSLQTSMDDVRLLAARLLADRYGKAAAPASRRRQQCPRRDPARPEGRAANRMARGKRPRGAGLLRRNGKTIKAPGEARPPRALPELSGSDAGESFSLRGASGRVGSRRRTLLTAAQHQGL